MKVAELIADLSKFPQDMEVLAGARDDPYYYALNDPKVARIGDEGDKVKEGGVPCVIIDVL